MKKRPTITLLRVEDLKPYAKNARTHSEEQVAQIARSVQEFGWTNPILLDGKRGVVAGHGRLLAARKLGLKRVPCIELVHLTPTQRRALVLADNQLALNAGWDLETLRLELEALKSSAFDLDVLGFSVEQVSGLLDKTEGLTEVDDAPEPPKHPVSRLGDLWVLGRHRLLCGDSTKAEDAARVMAGEKADLFSTDPPYLVGYTGADRPRDSGKDWSGVYNEVHIADAKAFFRALAAVGLRHVKEGAPWYWWHASKRAGLIDEVWTAAGVLNHQQIIWVKPTATLGFSFWPWQHEPCLMGWRKGRRPRHDGEHSQQVTSVWSVDWEGKRRLVGNEHPTQKPVELFARPMRKHTRPGDLCLEPFSGSGSQIIAGEKEARRVAALELAPAFVDVAVLRWQAFTGKQATLDGDGRTFEAVARSRAARSLKRAS